MKARFQPEIGATAPDEPVLVDPEAYDASEQQFAASLEGPPPRFVIKPENAVEEAPGPGPVECALAFTEVASDGAQETAIPEEQAPEKTQFDSPGLELGQSDVPVANSDSWREELAARLNNYRARRHPREPRYPSLRLKFEPSEPAWTAHAPADPQPSRLSVALDGPAFAPAAAVPPQSPEPIAAAEPTARIIPFPRSAIAPPRPLEELAGPVPARPRILEVPEVAPPPPALGGILIESVEEPVPERRPGFEIPLQSAQLAPRLLAAFADGLIVLIALAISGSIFLKLTAFVPGPAEVAAIAIAGAAILWCAYQYLLLVYTGTTPGLKLARLQISRFDGRVAPRRVRRWRVLASIVSGLSLGLGYAWCLLDEDQLCWHDRITRTYMASSRRPAPVPANS